MFFSIPALTGFLLGRGFDALSDGDTVGVVPRARSPSLVAEAARMASIHFGALMWTKAWVHMQTLLRANLLTAQVASGGPEAGQPVGSAGRGADPLPRRHRGRRPCSSTAWSTCPVALVFTVAAGFLLGAADAAGAAVLLIPLVGVVLDDQARSTGASRRTAPPTGRRRPPSPAWSAT